MPSSTQSQANTAKAAVGIKTGKTSPKDVTSGAVKMSKIPIDKLRHFLKMKECMNEDQKRRLLKVLKSIKEDYTGNIGGETDITNADNLMVNEDDFENWDNLSKPQQLQKLKKVHQSQGKVPSDLWKKIAQSSHKNIAKSHNPPGQRPSVRADWDKPEVDINEDDLDSGQEQNVIAKTFDTEADFDSYTNQRRGIEMTPKEQQVIINYNKAKPTQQDKFFSRFETTDDFGNNDTTVIKKLKDGNQFVWTAFSKHETSEEEGKPEGSEGRPEAGKGEEKEEETPEMKLKEQSENQDEDTLTVNDPIRITKSTTFDNETDGINILGNFLQKLDI